MYVDGFVLPVPEKNLKAYRAIAQKAAGSLTWLFGLFPGRPRTGRVGAGNDDSLRLASRPLD